MGHEYDGESAEGLEFRDELHSEDVHVIREIVESTGFFHPWEVEIAVELADERLNKGVASGYNFLFADSESQTEGYVCFGEIPCTRASYDVYWIAVRKQSQGRGRGRSLMLLAEQRMTEMGGRRVYVETSGRTDYLPTRRFYERHGYEVAAELPDFYEPGDAKVIYSKQLNN